MSLVKSTAYRIMIIIATILSAVLTIFNLFYYIEDVAYTFNWGYNYIPLILALQLIATLLLLFFAIKKVTGKNFVKIKTFAFISVVLVTIMHLSAARLTEMLIEDALREIYSWTGGYYYYYPSISCSELYVFAGIIGVLFLIAAFTLVRKKGVANAFAKNINTVTVTPLVKQPTQQEIEERLLKLKKLQQSGAITKEEYDEMFGNLIENKDKVSEQEQSKEVLDEETIKINKLKKMRDSGIISNEEYRRMLSEIF